MNKRWYESLLLIVYAAMVFLAVVLALTGGQRLSMPNIIINVVMFVIVGIVFFNCWYGSFRPMGEIIGDLDEAASRITEDARDTHEYLMTPYRNNKVELFESDRLRSIYRDFLFDLERCSASGQAYYKCDIEDYVNSDLIDSVLHRPQLGQVAGAMTGLGILGTFLGLSLGLQSFNTGSTAEITGSIEPLMDGIKVAFHTSIYGMVFSLVFNYVYKRLICDAEDAVTFFTTSFRKYVLPDTSNEGVNLLIAAERAQAEAIDRLSERIAEEVNRTVEPQFEKLNRVITDFAHVATEEQHDALTRVVEAFIDEMNRSLAGSFTRLRDIINDQYATQQENAALMRSVLDETASGVSGFSEINDRTRDLISTIRDYALSVDAVQGEIRRSIENSSVVNVQTRDMLAANEARLQAESELLTNLRSTVSQMTQKLEKSHTDNAAAVDSLTDAVDDLRETMDRLNRRGLRKLKS